MTQCVLKEDFGYINMLSKKASKIALEIYPGKPEHSLKPFF